MATTHKTNTNTRPPSEQLEELEAAVLRDLPSGASLTIDGERLERAAILTKLRGWRWIVTDVTRYLREAGELQDGGATLASQAEALAREVRAALDRYRRVRAFPAAANRSVSQAYLAMAKRDITRERRELGHGSKVEIPDGFLPWVD